MTDNITQGKTFTDLQSLNKIDGSSLFAVHLSGETYKMTYNQLLAQITGDLSYGAFDEIGNRFFSDRKTAPKGCLNCMDGAIYTQADTTYPELWQKIVEGKLNYISLEQYEVELTKRFGENNSLTGVCGYLGVDIPNKTFRMPTYPNARIALLVGTEPMFYDGQIINIKGEIQDDNGFNWRTAQSNGVFYNRPNLYAQQWTDDMGRNGSVGRQDYVFDASRVVKTGDQLRVPSTAHCLYMVVSSIRWEIQTVYAFNETVENEIVARTNADIEINNAIAAINEKIEGALTSYYKDTYIELQNFIRDNSAILKVGNVLICGGGSSGEPVRQFLWNGKAAIETSANIVLDNYYSKQQIDNFLDNKVDKIPGKSLSQNDYTNAEKIRLNQSILEPEYTAFKDNTQTKIDNLTNSINKEILDREDNDIVNGSTEGDRELSNVNPILYLHKENGDKVAISLDVLKSYLNSNSKGSNGSIILENIDSSSIEVEGTEDLGYFQIRDTKTSDNTTTLVKTHRSINDPVRLEFSLFHNTNPEDSVRLVLLNNGTTKRLYLLKDKELPTNTSEVQSLDEILNRSEIEDYVGAEIAEALTGVLPIPIVIEKESNLPDITNGATQVYYYVIENMDISSPNLLRQGRAWCGVGATTWEKIIDTVNTLSADSFEQKDDGSWIINEATQTLIDGAVQNSQITILDPNSSSTDQEVPSAKSVYSGLEKRISKSSIDIIEPTSLSTDDTVPSSKLINSMMGGNLSSLTTEDKTVIGSLNELDQNKVNSSLNNLNEEGQNYLNSLVSSQYISVGQLVPLMFPSNDAKLHLADGTLISQIGKYAQFSNYLKKVIDDNSILVPKYNVYLSEYTSRPPMETTVSEDGILSNFTNGEIAYGNPKSVQEAIENVVNFTYQTRFSLNYSSLPSTPVVNNISRVYSYLDSTGKIYLDLELLYVNNKLRFKSTVYPEGANNLSNKQIFTIDGTTTINSGIYYYARVRKEGTTLYLETSLDNKTYTIEGQTEIDFTFVYNGNGQEIELGSYSSSFDLSIDLNYTSLICSGTEVYSGKGYTKEPNPNLNLTCTQEEWDTILNTYGFCPKFVIDDTANTIRLPLLKGYMKGVNSIEELGKVNEAGLPNVSGEFNGVEGGPVTGPFSYGTGEEYPSVAGGSARIGDYKKFNLSKANPIYKDNLDTVEVDGYNCLVYIVVAIGATQSISVVENYEVNNTVPLTCPVYSPNLFEDINYLLSDNQFYSGTMYLAVWELLVSQYNNENSIEIVKSLSDGTELTLKKTPLDYLICKIDGNNTEEKINRFYDEIKFTCWVINTTTNEFKLPQNTQRTLVESWKDENGGWYNLYSDGWAEQGGQTGTFLNADYHVDFKIPFKDTNYNVNYKTTKLTRPASENKLSWEKQTTYMKIGEYFDGKGVIYISGSWKAEGYADTSALTNQFNFKNYLYFKVGNTTVNPEAIDVSQLTVEVSKKADRDLSNTTTRFLKLKQTIELSNGDTEVEFINLDNTKKYIINFENIICSATSGVFKAILGLDDSYTEAGYYNVTHHTWNGGTTTSGNNNIAYANIGYSSNALDSNINIKIELSFANGVTNMAYRLCIFRQNGTVEYEDGFAVIRSNNFNKIKLFLSSGVFVSGSISLYEI